MSKEELTPQTLDEAMESIKTQEPLQNVYESSDFKQGLNRGALLEQRRIIRIIEAGDWAGLSLEEDKENLKDRIRGRVVTVVKGPDGPIVEGEQK